MAKRKKRRQGTARALPLLRSLAKNAPEMVCQAEGHVKLTMRNGKVYRAVVRYVGKARWSKRAFRRAEEAEIYGRKLSARACGFAATPPLALTPALSQGERGETA